MQNNDILLPLAYPAAIFVCPPQERVKDLESLIENIHREFSIRTRKEKTRSVLNGQLVLNWLRYCRLFLKDPYPWGTYVF